MPRRGENIYKRKDGRFESRIPNGKKPDCPLPGKIDTKKHTKVE